MSLSLVVFPLVPAVFSAAIDIVQSFMQTGNIALAYRLGGLRVRERLGPDETEEIGEGTIVRISGEHEVVADLYLPTWLELSTDGTDSPNLFARIELRDQRPEIVAVSWSSGPGQREIKQKDLRDTQLAELLDLYRAYTMRVVETEHRTVVTSVSRTGIQRLRTPGNRVITDEFLASVAEVYRRNIAHAPTQAVARTFGVKPRMASNYVDKARRAGLLPPTKQGRKKA
jgi:hypothetical protein